MHVLAAGADPAALPLLNVADAPDAPRRAPLLLPPLLLHAMPSTPPPSLPFSPLPTGSPTHPPRPLLLLLPPLPAPPLLPPLARPPLLPLPAPPLLVLLTRPPLLLPLARPLDARPQVLRPPLNLLLLV